MKTPILLAAAILPLLAGNLFGEVKVAKDVSYGPHSRNVLDVYWKPGFKDAPIVFTIHGGGFKNGSKAYCNKDMQELYLNKGCVVVSPNYRLLKEGTETTLEDCEIDCAMAVAYIQANAEKYGGDPKRIVATGGSAGGYLSAQIAYKKDWKWPADTKHKPDKLNIIGWYGDSPFLPPGVMKNVAKGGCPGFMIYGQREHHATPAEMGHAMQKRLKENGIWNKLVYVPKAGHVPGKNVLIHAKRRDPAVFASFNEFLDMICYAKAKPMSGDVLTVGKG